MRRESEYFRYICKLARASTQTLKEVTEEEHQQKDEEEENTLDGLDKEAVLAGIEDGFISLGELKDILSEDILDLGLDDDNDNDNNNNNDDNSNDELDAINNDNDNDDYEYEYDYEYESENSMIDNVDAMMITISLHRKKFRVAWY